MKATSGHKSKDNLQFNWVVVFLLLPVLFIVSYWKQFNGLYGSESHENYRIMQGLFTFLSGGAAQPSYHSPILFPLAGAIVSLIIPKLFALQFVSIASAGVCYISFCRLLNQIYPEGTQRQRYAFLILFLSPFYLKAAIVGLADMLSMAFLMIALLESYKWRTSRSSQSMLFATCAAVLAVQTRYATFLLLLPVLPMIWTAVSKRFSILLICIFAIIITYTPSIFFKGQEGLNLLLHPWLKEWSALNLFSSTFELNGNPEQYTLPNIAFVISTLLHPGYCLIGLLFIIVSLRLKFRLPLSWVISHFLFLLFIAGLPAQNLRYLLPAFPIALLAFYPAYELIIFKFRTRNQRVAVYVVAVAIQILLAIKVITPVIKYQQEEYVIAASLKLKPVTTLNTYAIDPALRTYEIPQEVVNMWSTPDMLYMNGDLLLFNKTRFKSEDKNFVPYKSYVTLRNQGRLMFLNSYPNGWELYRIKQ
ncbi:MAG: hypothetical protein IPN36_02985 [Bacteroidetes bacterium]|nr:hypothetical protein [Bacteroidota bacterium]